MIDLSNEDLAYIKLVLYGTKRGREIAAKLPNPHHTKMKKKLKPVIDEGKEKITPSKKPYRTEPDYPTWRNNNG